MKTLTPKEIIRILESKGFNLKRTKGSHQVFYNPISNKTTIIPFHKKDLPIGTCLSILKQAGLSQKDLENN